MVSFDLNDNAKLNAFKQEYGIDDFKIDLFSSYPNRLTKNMGRIALERPQPSNDPLDPNGISWSVIDELYYLASNPGFNDAYLNGLALQRKQPIQAGSDSNSWRAVVPRPNDNQQTHMWFEAYATSGGYLSGSTNGWYDSNADMQVTAIANQPLYSFANWSGTIQSTNASLEFKLVEDTILTANFKAQVTDYGVPLWWLVEHGLTSAPWQVEVIADHDNDKLITWQEYYADTDPNDPSSRLEIIGLYRENDQFKLKYIGGNCVTQFVQGYFDSSLIWQTIMTNVPPTTITNSVIIPNTIQKYRVKTVR